MEVPPTPQERPALQEEQDRRAEEEAKRQYIETGTWWINVYSIQRRYGGPEEGGWWYDTGEPVASVPIEGGQDKARGAAGYWKKRYPRTDRRYSSIGGEDYDIRIQPHFAVAFPTERPRYE